MIATDTFAKPPARSFWARIAPVLRKADALFHTVAAWLTPLADLLARYWVAAAFFGSGLTKTLTGSFMLFGHTFNYPLSLVPTESTFTLFEYEYHVPVLSPVLAAYLGTAVELLMPVFLLLGLGTRYAAAVLFVFNVIAVVSYPELMDAGFQDHQVWGLLLLITICHGPGQLSLDYLIGRLMGR
ncbi:MAG: DoxX family protein [Gammaproteobacteria bacterium]|nr:DoxX family protein [Gammaproteobacteria bacterium]MCP5458365.1 DoxX family protein [Gammaproteobacteria bacterium]